MDKALKKKVLKFCADKKQRITLPRMEVLKIISLNKKPIKAYDILKKLSLVIENPKPPTAYRAIDFWLKHNFIHRVDSINAYIICKADHLHKGVQFMICDHCGKVIESHLCDLPEIIKNNVKKNIFQLSKWNLEIIGKCSQCA